MWKELPPLPVLAAWAAAAAAVAGVAALVFAWSGLYSVAASRGHWAITERFLEFALRSSVRTHSVFVDAPTTLDDPALVTLGAAHYAGACAPCHGGPGQARNPITQRMLPPPTELASAVPTWADRELFWIVRNGIKYTGMPGWVAPRRQDEIWAVVAFLRTLPGQEPARYRALASGNARGQPLPAGELLQSGTTATSLAACARCHGDAENLPTSPLVPILRGQTQAYLERALAHYAAGSRPSGIMQPVAAELDASEIRLLSAYYAKLPPKSRRPATDEAGESGEPLADAGRLIATQGIPASGIPPCTSCHGIAGSEYFPKLEGQYEPYLANQLRTLRQQGAEPGLGASRRIMATIAARLSDAEIDAAAAWFARRSRRPDGPQRTVAPDRP